MLLLVQIDLSQADVGLFEAYENRVLPLLALHNGQLELRVRALDGTSEAHLVCFAGEAERDAFLADPVRLEAQDEWNRSGARATVRVVERIDPVDASCSTRS